MAAIIAGRSRPVARPGGGRRPMGSRRPCPRCLRSLPPSRRRLRRPRRRSRRTAVRRTRAAPAADTRSVRRDDVSSRHRRRIRGRRLRRCRRVGRREVVVDAARARAPGRAARPSVARHVDRDRRDARDRSACGRHEHVVHRAGMARRSCRGGGGDHRHAPRRLGAGARCQSCRTLPGRGRADRSGRRAHPGGAQRADDGQPRSQRQGPGTLSPSPAVRVARRAWRRCRHRLLRLGRRGVIRPVRHGTRGSRPRTPLRGVMVGLGVGPGEARGRRCRRRVAAVSVALRPCRPGVRARRTQPR